MTARVQLPAHLLTQLGDRRYRLDLRGYSCPYPQLFAAKALSQLEPGASLEVVIDNPPSVENVLRSIAKNGHEHLGTEKVGPSVWVIRARRPE
ncbi:MAG: sulfurtransferase TusA family protein [Thaumarchaeota archaeon]|nr:sulfurtransferase TusA family protein [Candidatus Calditenuaceae archaeon]MDW8042227.1 sulfurtransferase TusA family protein [Nitrososphaerota archaeon]